MEAQATSLYSSTSEQVLQEILTAGIHILLFSDLLPMSFVSRMVYLTYLSYFETVLSSEIHNMLCSLEYACLKN